MPLGTEVGLGPGDIVLDGDPAPLPKKGCPIFGPFLHPVFAASRVQLISGLHSKFALGPRHV